MSRILFQPQKSRAHMPRRSLTTRKHERMVIPLHRPARQQHQTPQPRLMHVDLPVVANRGHIVVPIKMPASATLQFAIDSTVQQCQPFDPSGLCIER